MTMTTPPTYESIRVGTTDRVTTVTMARPDRRNAVDGPMAAELARAFTEFDEDPDADVAVLYGEGGAFCAGADLKSIGTPRSNRVELDGDGPMGPTRLALSKPVIAAVEGFAVAGGLELAIWCDCVWPPPTRPSGSSAGVGASRSSTVAPCAYPG